MKRLSPILAWLITLALPFFLGFMNIRLLITPTFLEWEYGKTNFPPDRYGFSQEQRLELATVAIQFLASPERPEEAISMLEAQTAEGAAALQPARAGPYGRHQGTHRHHLSRHVGGRDRGPGRGRCSWPGGPRAGRRPGGACGTARC